MNSSDNTVPPTKLWLLLTLLAFAALWFLYPQEFIASDPGAYSWRAFAISQHLDFGNGGIFDERLGVTLPVGAIYSIFGVNILTTNLWPLLAALIVIVTVWLALPEDNSRILGVLLCLTSIPLLQASIALYPDIIATAFMAASSLLLFERKRLIEYEKSKRLYPLAAVFFLFLAFLAKESAYWTLPLWIMALLNDLKSDEKGLLLRRFYLPTLILGAVLGFGYLLFCQIIWGDPLSRFHSVQALTGQHLWSWQNAAPGELLKRLTTAPAELFIDQYGILILSLSALGLVTAPASVRPWTYYTIFCLLFFWFGSTSFTRYEPMPLVDRMALPLLPAFYILTASMVSRFKIASEQMRSINSLLPVLIILALTALPFAGYVRSWHGVDLPETTAMAVVRNDVKRHPDQKYLLICSDSRSPNSLSFYFGYLYPTNLHVLFAGDLTQDLLKDARTYVFMDRQRSAFLRAAYGKRSYDTEIDELGLPALYRSGAVTLIKTDQQNTLKNLIH